ncbi:MAG: cytidine deaminase [Wenzhouxiangella sp.]
MDETLSEPQAPKGYLERLKAARANAYVPYSAHPVAALLVTDSGELFCACNVETAHFKSVCAEAGAISALISAGEKRIREVWILGPGPNPCPPCGDCRQRIHEFADAHTRIHLVDEQGRVLKSYSVPELLPEAFGGP